MATVLNLAPKLNTFSKGCLENLDRSTTARLKALCQVHYFLHYILPMAGITVAWTALVCMQATLSCTVLEYDGETEEIKIINT